MSAVATTMPGSACGLWAASGSDVAFTRSNASATSIWMAANTSGDNVAGAGCAGRGSGSAARFGAPASATVITPSLLKSTIAGGASFARAGALENPTSSSEATLALRCAVDVPPNTVAIIRVLPRSAEATRLNPAALVNPVLIPSAPL